MNELHKAFNGLGLEPGTGFETIKRRYRILALAWHPDRMTKPDAKKEAEEELKKINNYFEKLKKHFDAEHKAGPSCRCQPAADGPPPNHANGASGPAEAAAMQMATLRQAILDLVTIIRSPALARHLAQPPVRMREKVTLRGKDRKNKPHASALKSVSAKQQKRRRLVEPPLPPSARKKGSGQPKLF